VVLLNIGLVSLLGGLSVLQIWRIHYDHQLYAEWQKSSLRQARSSRVFSHSMIAELPEPVQRYYKYAIAEGATLRGVVTLNMQGQFGMGTKHAPLYQPMCAQQILAALGGSFGKCSPAVD